MSGKKDKEIISTTEIQTGAGRKQSFFSRFKAKRKARREKNLQPIPVLEGSEENEKKIEEKLAEATSEIKESKSSPRKKKIKNILFFVFNIVLVAAILIWSLYTTEDFTPFRFKDINLLFLFAVFAMLILINVLDTISIHRMIYRKTFRSRWALSYKSVGILRYYDAVTPLASGGQAFMATYLMGRGISGSTSLSIPLAKYLFQQIAWLIVTLICLILSFVYNMSTLVSAASIIGFILSAGVTGITLFLSLSKKVGKKLVSGILKLLVKMHILKDFDKYYGKVTRFVEDYQNVMKEYSTSKKEVFVQMILNLVHMFIFFSIPFFIFCSFRGFDGSKFGELFIYTAMIDLAACFIPLPGGSGMSEITFTALFTKYLGGYTFWAMLLWRFCSYYFYLLQGVGLIAYDTIYGNRKYRWVKVKYALQEESQEFRKVQIESFRMERSKRRKKQKKVAIPE